MFLSALLEGMGRKNVHNYELKYITEIVYDHKPYCSSGSYSRNHDPKYKGASRRGGAAQRAEAKPFRELHKLWQNNGGDCKCFILTGCVKTGGN